MLLVLGLLIVLVLTEDVCILSDSSRVQRPPKQACPALEFTAVNYRAMASPAAGSRHASSPCPPPPQLG